MLWKNGIKANLKYIQMDIGKGAKVGSSVASVIYRSIRPLHDEVLGCSLQRPNVL